MLGRNPFRSCRRGASAVEYGALAGLIAAGAIVAVDAVGGSTSDLLADQACAIGSVVDPTLDCDETAASAPDGADVVSAGANAAAYHQGDVVRLEVGYDEAVFVTGGVPRLQVDAGGVTFDLAFDPASDGSETLAFTGVVPAGAVDGASFDVIGDAIDLAGATLTAGDGSTDVETALPSDPLAGVGVSHPDPVAMTGPADGVYAAGDALEFVVTWPSGTTIDQAGVIGIDVGGTRREAVPTAGVGSDGVTYTYVLSEDDLGSAPVAFDGAVVEGVSGGGSDFSAVAPDLSGVRTAFYQLSASLKHTDNIPGESGGYGSSVALDGGSLLVGSPGRGHDWNTTGIAIREYLWNTNYSERQYYATESHPESNVLFGTRVAADGGVGVIGAPYEDAGGRADAGAAYLVPIEPFADEPYLRIGMPGYAEEKAYFGSALDVDGGIAVISAPHAGDYAGAVYLFDAATGGLLRELVPDAGVAPNDRFGTAVAIDGGKVAVFAHGGGSSRVHVFSAATGQEIGVITEGMVPSLSRFDGYLDLSGDRLALAGVTASPWTRHVYLFDVSDFTLSRRLSADWLGWNDDFATRIAMDGDRLVVAAPREASVVTDGGAAYLYDAGTGALKARLSGDYGDGDKFGYSLAIEGDVIAVGADADDVDGKDNAGSVFVFDATGL